MIPPRIRIFDPVAFSAALDEDEVLDDYLGPEEERPAAARRPRMVEEEVWARVMRRIVADPEEGYRSLLLGDEPTVLRLRIATATMPHFAAVTGIVERAVQTSAITGLPIRFPPVLMLSEPGLGKTHYARAVAAALGTRAVPIALNATSDRGQIGGSSPAWRGAKLGKFARTLIEGDTAAPLFLLDEIDKCSNIANENVAAILLSALEPENAREFVDEYVDLPMRLDQALWLASANDLHAIPAPLLSRLLVVEVPRPSERQARVIVRAIAKAAVGRPIDDDAVDLLTGLSPREARQAIELAFAFTACAHRHALSADEVGRGVGLVAGRRRRGMGFTGGV